MFDSHCHLFMDDFKDNLNEVINVSRENGVNYLLIPAINFKTSKDAVRIANLYNGVYAAVGIHPTNEDLENQDIDSLFYKLEELTVNEVKVKAIGETGLDYYRYTAPIRIQQEYFIRHIKLAHRTNKSLIIHSRQSTEDVIRILKENWSDDIRGKVVLHAAEAIEDTIRFAEEYNIYIGVDGDVTYDNSKMEFIKKVPLELLVVETDSPYLCPKPIRDAKSYPNTPENLIFIVKKAAELKGVSVEQIEDLTTRNAKKLFSI